MYRQIYVQEGGKMVTRREYWKPLRSVVFWVGLQTIWGAVCFLSICDYSAIGKGTRVHISYADPKPGKHEIPAHRKFVETIGEEYRKDREGRLVPFSKEVRYRLND